MYDLYRITFFVCINFDITICSTFYLIKITKQQQKTQPVDNNWFDCGGRESLFIFLSSLLWHVSKKHIKFGWTFGVGPMPTRTPFPLIHIKENEEKYGFSRQQIYKSYTNIAANSRESCHVHCEFTKHHVNIWYMFIPSSFFPSDTGLPRLSGWGCFGERCIWAWRFVGSQKWPPP